MLSFCHVYLMSSYLSTKYMKFKICKNLMFVNVSSTNKQLAQYSHIVLKRKLLQMDNKSKAFLWNLR